MALAIYRKAQNAYLHERVLFHCENTEELFREVKGTRTSFKLIVSFTTGELHPAFTISGLSEDLMVLDAALMLSGIEPLSKRVAMLIVDIGLEDPLIRPAILESDVSESILTNIIGNT